MSYETGLHVRDFGTVDRANLERAEAAKAVVTANERGLDEDPAYDQALDHVANYGWGKASDAIAPLLEGSTNASSQDGAPASTPAEGLGRPS